MKQPKKYLSLILAFIILLLAGCKYTDPESTAATSDGTITAIPTQPEPVITCQYLPAEIDDNEDLPVLKWVCLAERQFGGGVRTWNETAVHEVNQMLADRDMPFRIQFVLLTMDQWLIDSGWFARPEAQKELVDADLIYGQMRAADMRHYLLPITEYTNSSAEISLENAVPHKYNWLIGTVANEVYGIPTALNQAYVGGWIMNSEFLTKYDLTGDAFLGDFWEMDNLFKEIYKNNNEEPFLFVNRDTILTSGNSFTGEMDSCLPGALYKIAAQSYKGSGACFAIDYTLDTPIVVNTLQTENARKIQSALARYKEAGYITDDQSLAQLSYGTVFGDCTYTDATENVMIPNTISVFHATASGGPVSGIAANSQYKAEALALLNLIAEDKEFRMQLFYGKEGRDYTVTDGYYEIKRYEDGSSYSLDFLSPLSYFSGLTSNIETANFLSPGTENWYLFTYDDKDLLETYQQILDNSILSYPIIFDYSGFESELKAMEAVYEKYFPDFSNLTEDQYNKMLQELEIAGSEKVLDALQLQLDQWLSKNPNW